MDQLVVLQEIYESFSKGGDALQKINSRAIVGSSPELVRKMVESAKKGRIDEDVCSMLAECLEDVYEVKRLGDICRKAGLYGLAIESYNKALSLCRDKTLRSVLHNNLGQAYARQGDFSRASFYYEKAARSFEAAGDSSGLAHVLGNLGSAHRRNKNWDKSIEHCYRSLKIFEKNGDDLGTAQMTGSLGRIYAEMGERELAVRYFERSLTEFQRLGDKKSAAWILDRLGRIAAQRKDWDKALGYYNQSFSLFDQQGQSQSAGIVLSNLGRTYLDMGEATVACESLERAVRLIPRNMHPNYQNALSGLAASYSFLGRENLREAIGAKGYNESDRSTSQAAFKYYSRAADRYIEMASYLKVVSPDIKAAAAIAKSRSYLAKLSGTVSDEEAVSLAERALIALDSAAGTSKEEKKAKIENLQKILAGMKEVWSISLIETEPWKLFRAVTNASEKIIGGAGGCSTGETNGYLCDALQNLSASIDAIRTRKAPTETLKAAASSLRKAKDASNKMEKETGRRNAQKLIEAAEILEGLANNENGRDKDESAPHIQDVFNFRPEREALLLIGWALINNALSVVDDTDTVFTWDDTLNMEVHSPANSIIKENIKIKELKEEPIPQTIPVADRPNIEISKERARTRDLILADGTVEASEVFVSEMANPEPCYLVPVTASMVCKTNSQHIDQDKPLWKAEVVEAPIKTQQYEILIKDTIGQGIDAERKEESAKDVSSDVGGIAKDLGPSIASGYARESIFSRSKGIMLLKGMTILVILLLVVEAILYLI
jgi:tetratricopeptide (TPR) repeat protein